MERRVSAIVYDIVYDVAYDIVYDITKLLTVNGTNRDAPLDICSINVNDQRNRNFICAYANLSQLK